jgi:lysophospholipase L1-like esterase
MKSTGREFFCGGARRGITAMIAALALGSLAHAEAWTAEENFRVYPVGDSITNGIKGGGGYRLPLHRLLQADGASIHFVGNLESGPDDFLERRHDGHDGWVIDDISEKIEAWLDEHRPRVMLLMIGINDIEAGVDIQNAPKRLSRLLDKIAGKAPDAEILLAELTLIPDPALDRQAEEFNSFLPQIVASQANQGHRVRLVPMHDAYPVSDLEDYDHPGPEGNRKMALRWRNALLPIIPR